MSDVVEKSDAPAAVEPAVITSIKGFRVDLSCRPDLAQPAFQFEFGKTYSIPGEVRACKTGFHACPVDQHPLSVFEFYSPAGSRYAIVEQSGEMDRRDTKLASATLSLKVEISIGDLVKRAWDYVWSRATLETGASATGDSGAASATGVRGAASATGDSGAASATGDSGAASATGVRGAASATGLHSVAVATGEDGRAMAAETGAIFLVNRDSETDAIRHVFSSLVGENGIEPNKWYSLDDDGKPFEVDADGERV